MFVDATILDFCLFSVFVPSAALTAFADKKYGVVEYFGATIATEPRSPGLQQSGRMSDQLTMQTLDNRCNVQHIVDKSPTLK